MGFIGERLGFSKTKVEIISMIVTFGFYALLFYVLVASGTLEQKCRVMLPNGSLIMLDPNEQLPELHGILVQSNRSLVEDDDKCSYRVVCEKRMVCNFSGSWVDESMVGCEDNRNC